jgi:hypothetical protein
MKNLVLLAGLVGLALFHPASSSAADPAFATSDPNGGWSNGGYYVHNNMWNAKSGETLYARAYHDWSVTATYPETTDVKTYPNVHKDINGAKGTPLNDFQIITSTFAAQAPPVGIYDVAYDIWLNGVGGGKGVSEFMIWTENRKQVPLGKVQDHVTFDDATYDAYHYAEGGANVVTLVPAKVMTAGNLNLKAILNWAVKKGWLPANPTVNQICYGVEICSTGGKPATFTFANFSVTMK